MSDAFMKHVAACFHQKLQQLMLDQPFTPFDNDEEVSQTIELLNQAFTMAIGFSLIIESKEPMRQEVLDKHDIDIGHSSVRFEITVAPQVEMHFYFNASEEGIQILRKQVKLLVSAYAVRDGETVLELSQRMTQSSDWDRIFIGNEAVCFGYDKDDPEGYREEITTTPPLDVATGQPIKFMLIC